VIWREHKKKSTGQISSSILMSPDHPPFSPADRLIGRTCFEHSVPVWWGEPDVPGSMNSGSGALVQLGRPLLITAGHVISAYIERLQQNHLIHLRVGDGILDRVLERVISISEANPDLATLDLTGVDIKSFGEHVSFHEAPEWPPDRVVVDTRCIMNGFLKAHRSIDFREHLIYFNSWQVFTAADSVGHFHFSCVIDPEQIFPTINQEATWPQIFGALSGGPVFCLRGELLRLELAGITYEASDSLNAFLSHHADLVRSDGTIN